MKSTGGSGFTGGSHLHIAPHIAPLTIYIYVSRIHIVLSYEQHHTAWVRPLVAWVRQSIPTLAIPIIRID